MYETENGAVPFADWMSRNESNPIYDIVMARLDRVEFGNLGEHRAVGEGVVELVVNYGPGYRIYIGQDGKELVILLVAGDKSSQQRDIKAAKAYWRKYNA